MKTTTVLFKKYQLIVTHNESTSSLKTVILTPEKDIIFASSSYASNAAGKGIEAERLKECLISFLEVHELIKVSDVQKYYGQKLKKLHKQGILKNLK